MQTGTLDAAEFVGPYNDLALGLYQITKNYASWLCSWFSAAWLADMRALRVSARVLLP